MRITLEPRKTTWVPFIDCRAKLEREWRCRVEYRAGGILGSHDRTARTRYVFTGLESEHPLPSSQLVIMEQGVPLTITRTVVSATRDRFESEEVDDPFLEITDKLAGLERSDRVEKRLAKGLVERTWVETLRRNVEVENRTGRDVTLRLTLVDCPAEELRFVSSEPAPERSQPPEYEYELALAGDEKRLLQATFTWHRTETIRAPVEPPQRPGASPRQGQQAQEFVQLAECIEEFEEPGPEQALEG